MTTDSTSGTSKPLVLRFGGSLVEQLGAQLYPSATATVAELISNAWDANAKHVWITIPLGKSWGPTDTITVLDDGHGMDRQQAQDAYLIVGRRRRLEGEGVFSEGKKRRVHGRKGIGKLAAFGTAAILECTTTRNGLTTAFTLNYEDIRKLHPTEDYEVDPLEVVPLAAPDGSPLDHGTRVVLRNLRLRKATSKDQFIRSMARRFALDDTEMVVMINTDQLPRYAIATEFRFPADGLPPKPQTPITVVDGWAHEVVDGHDVRWWIGFTELPLGDDEQQGISILANGKLAQRPFKFDRSQGTEGQLGQEYLVGEVIADYIDESVKVEDDLIQSNRDQLQLEDERLEGLLEWGKKRLTWALRERAALRRQKNEDSVETNPEIDKILEPYTKTEQKRFKKVADIVAKWPEATTDTVVDTLRSVVDASADRAVREMMEEIELTDDSTQEQMWKLVQQFGLVDARRTLSIIEARLSTIQKLKAGIAGGAREVPDIHQWIVKDPWLLDPRWNLLDDELDVSKFGVKYEPEVDEEGNILDFMFGLAPRAPAPLDEVVIVEIKRGSHADGKVRRANDNEVNKFHGYVLAAQSYFASSTDPPRVRGLMIAQAYTEAATRVRKSLEQLPSPPLSFRTWDLVIDDTERMHLGWLNVSKERLE